MTLGKSNMPQQFGIALLSASILKSPVTIKFSYIDECKANSQNPGDYQ